MPFPWMGTSFVSMSLIVISIILMGVSSARPHVFDGVRSHVSDFFSPVIGVVSLPFQNITAMAQNAANFAQLQAKNQKLEQENDRLREWYQTALLLNSENKSLRDLLNLNIREEHKHIGARVIADAGNTYVKSLIALAGGYGGVYLSGLPVGRVVLNDKGMMDVVLFSDFNRLQIVRIVQKLNNTNK